MFVSPLHEQSSKFQNHGFFIAPMWGWFKHLKILWLKLMAIYGFTTSKIHDFHG
jgi:hypothetical protein